jgi:hypothetical protein
VPTGRVTFSAESFRPVGGADHPSTRRAPPLLRLFCAHLRMALHSPAPYGTVFISRHSISACGPTLWGTPTHTNGACGEGGLRPGTWKPPRTRAAPRTVPTALCSTHSLGRLHKAVRPSHEIFYQPAALQHCRSLLSEGRSAVAYLHAADK